MYYNNNHHRSNNHAASEGYGETRTPEPTFDRPSLAQYTPSAFANQNQQNMYRAPYQEPNQGLLMVMQEMAANQAALIELETKKTNEKSLRKVYEKMPPSVYHMDDLVSFFANDFEDFLSLNGFRTHLVIKTAIELSFRDFICQRNEILAVINDAADLSDLSNRRNLFKVIIDKFFPDAEIFQFKLDDPSRNIRFSDYVFKVFQTSTLMQPTTSTRKVWSVIWKQISTNDSLKNALGISQEGRKHVSMAFDEWFGANEHVSLTELKKCLVRCERIIEIYRDDPKPSKQPPMKFEKNVQKKGSCWNCDSTSHVMKDCPAELNRDRFQRDPRHSMRRRFLKKK